MSTTFTAPGHARTPRRSRIATRFFGARPPRPAPEAARGPLGAPVAAPPWLHEDGTWTTDRIPAAPAAAREITPQVRAKLAELDEQARAEQQRAAGFHAAPEAAVNAAGCPPWLGAAAITMPDNRAAHGRPFIPGVLGVPDRLSPRTAPVLADLGALALFREAVRAEIVRTDTARGVRHDGEPWDARYAAALERRTGPVVVPDFALAAMMRDHYTGPATVLPRHLVAWDDAEAGTSVAA